MTVNLSLSKALAIWLVLGASAAADWRADIVSAPGRVTAVEITGADVRVAIGQDWYRLAGDPVHLESAPSPDRPAVPAGALPDARVAVGPGTVARAWLASRRLATITAFSATRSRRAA